MTKQHLVEVIHTSRFSCYIHGHDTNINHNIQQSSPNQNKCCSISKAQIDELPVFSHLKVNQILLFGVKPCGVSAKMRSALDTDTPARRWKTSLPKTGGRICPKKYIPRHDLSGTGILTEKRAFGVVEKGGSTDRYRPSVLAVPWSVWDQHMP